MSSSEERDVLNDQKNNKAVAAYNENLLSNLIDDTMHCIVNSKEIDDNPKESNTDAPAIAQITRGITILDTVPKICSVEVTLPVSGNLGALGDLNVYDSDSDDSPEEVPKLHNLVSENISSGIKNKYREIEVEQIDSDSSDSDEYSTSSSESSDETSSFSDSESIYEAQAKVINQAKIPKTDGEFLLDELPPIEDLHITVPEQECMEIGKVSGIVDKIVVVQTLKNTPALDLDSVLFLNKGQQALGRIFDVIGPVCEPAYCVRFNSVEHIREKSIEKGLSVYCAPKTDHTSYVFLGELLKMKGSDASWKANNEPPQEFLEFSDDEEERKARRRKRHAPSNAGNSSAINVVEPSTYERHMNAKNAARSRFPHEDSSVRDSPVRQYGRGGGWVRPGIVIQNMYSAQQLGNYYVPPSYAPRPGYTIRQGPVVWPSQDSVSMFPNLVSHILPPYQFGLGTGPFFSMPPPMNQNLPSSLFSTHPPPPPPPHNSYQHQ